MKPAVLALLTLWAVLAAAGPSCHTDIPGAPPKACATCSTTQPLRCATCKTPGHVVDPTTGACRKPLFDKLPAAKPAAALITAGPSCHTDIPGTPPKGCATCSTAQPLRCATCKAPGYIIDTITGACRKPLPDKLLAASPAATVSATSGATFAQTARAVGAGGSLTVTGYRLAGDAAVSTLELKRFEVWKKDAVVAIQSSVNSPAAMKPAPDTRYFRGTIAGVPGSAAMLAVRPDGGVTGMAWRGNTTWTLGRAGGLATLGNSAGAQAAAISPGAASGALSSVKVDATDLETLPPFQCGSDALTARRVPRRAARRLLVSCWHCHAVAVMSGQRRSCHAVGLPALRP